jgi:hypothetical protein
MFSNPKNSIPDYKSSGGKSSFHNEILNITEAKYMHPESELAHYHDTEHKTQVK